MKTLSPAPAKIEIFPEQLIRESINSWCDEQVKKRETDPFVSKERKNTLYDVLPVFDSLAVLHSMLVIEEILDQKVPARFIKAGGYDSSTNMLDHLLPQLRELHQKKNNH